MIEQPLITRGTFASRENVREVLRRIRRRYRKELNLNPNNRLTVTSEQYRNYYKFSFVRNPWARAYSWYKNVMCDEIHQVSLNVSGEMSFTEFLRRHCGQGMLRPQTYWIKDFHGVVPLDFIGRFERLTEDFHKVCDAIGLPRITLPHEIKGASDGYQKHYDQESVQIIAQKYAQEIELFGYTFE